MKHVYLREIDITANDSLATIARCIPENCQVLDVGTGSGALGRYLKPRNCRVDGITYSEEEALLAQPDYAHLEVINLERTLPSACFAKSTYDVVVCADILEHLRNPLDILCDIRDLLAPGGTVLLSIPNATYMGVIFGLMGGRFVRTQEGILDATHVNFFDRRGLENLIGAAGFRVTQVTDVRKGLVHSEFARLDTPALPATIRHYVQSLPDADVYQFVWTLAPLDGSAPYPALEIATTPDIQLNPQFSAQLFRDGGAGFDEAISAHAWGDFSEEPQTLVFEFSEAPTVLRLRLDFTDRPGIFEFIAFRLFDRQGNLLGTWQGDWSPALQLNECEILSDTGPHGGRLIRATGSDPWVSLPADPAWSIATRAELCMTAPQLYNDLVFLWAKRRFSQTIDGLQASLSDCTTRLSGLEQALQSAYSENEKLSLERDALARAITEIKASTSWRITAGLRRIAQLLGKH